MPDEETVALQSMGNEIPDAMAGDLHVTFKLQKHKVFRRVGADLYMKKKISLKEALLGFNFEFKTLDGESVVVSSQKGQFISNGEVMTVKAKGLPFYEKQSGRGNIFIEFEVEYPKAEEIGEGFESAIDEHLPGSYSKELPVDSGQKVTQMVRKSSIHENTNPSGGSQERRRRNFQQDQQQGGGAESDCNVQ
jgi:DnaJ family protein A protein 2